MKDEPGPNTTRFDGPFEAATSIEHLDHLFSGLPSMVHSFDANGRLKFVSDQWLKKMGYAKDEVIGRRPTDFLTEASRKRAKTVVMPKLAKEGRCDDVAYQFVTKSGRIMDVLLSAVQQKSGTGEGLHTLTFLKDVTSLRQTERELRDERGRLHSIISGTQAGTWEWNVQTKEARFNDEWCRMIGYPREDFLNDGMKQWSSIVHPEDRPVASAAKQAHFEGKTEFYECNVRVRHKEGHWVWMQDRGQLQTRTPDGKPEWMFGTQVDINERVQQETALRRSEQILEQTGRIAGVGGWEFDLRTNDIMWTDETCNIHGVEPGYKPKLNEAIDFYAPEARPIITAAVESAIQTGEGWDLELPFIQRDGTRIWVRALGKAEFEGETPVRIRGAFQDITRRIEQTNELELAQQRVNLATVSGGIGVWEFELLSNSVKLDPTMIKLFEVQDRRRSVDVKSWLSAVNTADEHIMSHAVRRAILTQEPIDLELRVNGEDGTRYLRVSANAHLGADNLVDRLIGVAWDVTAERHLTQQLAQKNELMRVTFASIGDAVITTDTTGHIDWMNPVAEQMTGWHIKDAKGLPSCQVFQIVNDPSGAPTPDPIAACIAKRTTVALEPDTLLLSRDGTKYPIEDSAAPIIDADGEFLGVVLVFHDVTDQRRLAKDMEHRATHDALTGLCNRAELERRLDETLCGPGLNHPTSALLIDLDHFKVVNDTAGHSEGDRLLVEIAALLAEIAGPEDTVARIGGDEFVVILENYTPEAAQDVAEQMLTAISEFRLTCSAGTFRVGASLGVVHIDDELTNSVMVLKAADDACYCAKNAGRSRLVVWNKAAPGLTLLSGQMAWAVKVEQALDQDQFAVYAQRIRPISEASGAPLCELLLRMIDNDGTVHLPGEFMPAAEQFGLAPRIDQWMFSQALALAGDALASGLPDRISINVSALSLLDPGFQTHVLEQLQGQSPDLTHRMCLEITEITAITHLDQAAEFMEKLRAAGVSTALDDFGAGATAFKYLSKLPLDYLKIDGQIVSSIKSVAFNASIVRCFVDIAHAAGIRTVAEYVEDQNILDAVSELNVDLVQGFHIHVPQPVAKVLV